VEKDWMEVGMILEIREEKHERLLPKIFFGNNEYGLDVRLKGF